MATRKPKAVKQAKSNLTDLVERRTTQYQASDDVAKWIHSNKTHRSVSEAFRNADYATAFWRYPTEWERTWEYLQWMLIWGGFLFVMYLFMGFFK